MTFRVGRGNAIARAEAAEADELPEDPRENSRQRSGRFGMTAGEALSGMLSRPFGFSGTATQGEFIFKIIWINLFVTLPAVVLALTAALNVTPAVLAITMILYVILGIWSLVYGLPLQVRRMRDTGRSGWWVLWVMVAGGVIAAFDPTQKLAGLLNLGFLLYLSAKPSK